MTAFSQQFLRPQQCQVVILLWCMAGKLIIIPGRIQDMKMVAAVAVVVLPIILVLLILLHFLHFLIEVHFRIIQIENQFQIIEVGVDVDVVDVDSEEGVVVDLTLVEDLDNVVEAEV